MLTQQQNLLNQQIQQNNRKLIWLMKIPLLTTLLACLAAVRSFTVVRRPVSEAFAEDVPYVVALVVLDEGPTLMTNIIACKIEELRIGTQVTVCFEKRGASATLPQFTPTR